MSLHRHNPLLVQKLRPLVEAGEGDALLVTVERLSVAERRTAGYLLSTDLLVKCSSAAYWQCFRALVPSCSKAYLGTFLKALSMRFRLGQKELDVAALSAFAAVATPIDVRKTLETLLVLRLDVDTAARVVEIFTDNSLEPTATLLLKVGNPVSYYLLFQLLRRADVEAAALRHYAILLMRKADALSFKMASALRLYFGLTDLPGTFSLRLEAYELSRLEQGFEPFLKTLQIQY